MSEPGIEIRLASNVPEVAKSAIAGASELVDAELRAKAQEALDRIPRGEGPACALAELRPEALAIYGRRMAFPAEGIADAARKLGVSRQTVYRIETELRRRGVMP